MPLKDELANKFHNHRRLKLAIFSQSLAVVLASSRKCSRSVSAPLGFSMWVQCARMQFRWRWSLTVRVMQRALQWMVDARDVRGKEREKTGTGKKLERTRFFPFPFLQILTSAHLYFQLCAPISLSSDTCFLFCFFLRIALFFAHL